MELWNQSLMMKKIRVALTGKISKRHSHSWSKANCDVNGAPKANEISGSFNQKTFKIHKDFIISLLENP